MTSELFTFIESLQGARPWGAVLDAGTGVNSSDWISGLDTERWTAITGAQGHADQVRSGLGNRMRPQDRLIVGNWMDESLLRGEAYDTVLADYLLGAIEGFGPYFQNQLFARLRPHVRPDGRLYVVGLDPYIVGPARSGADRHVRAIGRFRDCCLLLANETPYREYPAEWAVNQLRASGYRVLTARRFANRYKAKWIDSQIDMGLRRLSKLADRALAASLKAHARALRAEALALCAAENGLRSGYDYVIAAEPVS